MAGVYEANGNWIWLYEVLEKIKNVKRIEVANPYRVRWIAEAQIKTDKLDARKLGMLLRLNVVPAIHVPAAEARAAAADVLGEATHAGGAWRRRFDAHGD